MNLRLGLGYSSSVTSYIAWYSAIGGEVWEEYLARPEFRDLEQYYDYRVMTRMEPPRLVERLELPSVGELE